MALIVPTGMSSRGLRKEPLILMPTMMPVTAGKKTAKVSQKLPSLKSPTNTGVSVSPELPRMGKAARKTENNEKPTMIKISSWVLEANWALT